MKLRTICQKISREEDIDDLFQSCIEQLLTNKKSESVPEKERLFFFARIVTNNYRSKTSIYYNEHKKFKYQELGQIEIREEEYKEPKITMEWLEKELESMRDEDWYFMRLFQLYLEEGASITKLSRRTTIPINSVSRDINKVKKLLKEKKQKILK